MAALPLTGIRVLDMSRVLAGPLCGMMLGDLGADVIKVERAGRGDETREWGPPFDDRGRSAYFLSTNRNKRSLAVDLRVDSDRGLISDLVRDADVVLENFLPGTLEQFGMSASAALETNTRLIWCTITGFGAASRRPGYDFVVQAESGWMSITGEPAGEPMKAGVALADVIAGKDAAVAILAALAGRERRHPIERRLVISLIDSARAALVNVAQNALVSGANARRWGNAHANLTPYQLFQASDRAIVIAVGSDDQWMSCVRALGLSDLERDARLATNSGRLANRDVIVHAFADRLRQRSAAEWMSLLHAARVPCGIIKSVLEAIGDAGDVSAITGMPSSVRGTPRLPPPELDEHGAAIRRNGWNAFPVTR
ncbi:MAG TPA: CoA transferase [Gemmatimonadaceae bacterium]|nr:CoA transferase [Gemmatimonadaceae bacterium]